MLMSHTYRFIFIHIYKTAGTSIMSSFLPYSRLIDRMAYDYKISKKLFGGIVHLMGWQKEGMQRFTGFHKHAKAYEIEKKIGSENFESYYKFAFVRNPFDLLVSLYFYISQAKNNPLHKAAVVQMSFLEFLKWYLAKNPPHQLEFVTDQSKSQAIVDYIGRFETLTEDVAVIRKTLGLEVNRKIKHKNRSVKRKTRNYQEYYCRESRKLVFDYFQSDLDLFGYDFDGVQRNMRIV